MRLLKYEELELEIQQKINSANVFFQKEFVNYVYNTGEELFFAFDEERIVPIRHRKKVIFNFGVLVSEPFELRENLTKDLSTYLDEVVEILRRKLGIQWCNSTAAGLYMDTPSHHCKRIPFGSHIINLNESEDELWKKVHSKHRNVIRKAEKENIQIKKGGLELLDDYILLEQETSDRTGRCASGKEYYNKQLLNLGKRAIIYIAYKDDCPQAGGLFYYNSARCYYMYGATSMNSFTGSANLLMWRAILDMKNSGVKEFSFVGCRINEDEDSKYHGIQRFKERFGGELRQGYMFRYESSPFFYKIFCRAMQIRTRKKTIFTDPIDEELHKWKEIQV